MQLELDRDWLEPGYTPQTLFESPFLGYPCVPRFLDCYRAATVSEPWRGSLESFAAALLAAVDAELDVIDTPVDLLVGGGYDSRILLALLSRRADLDLRTVTDGEEEPYCTETLDHLAVPPGRRYVHDLQRADPYGLTHAVCLGFAPLYTQLRFMPRDTAGRTVVTGLGGGEWFSYPASDWHRGKRPRISHDTVVGMWMDCWPQYTLIPDVWARGYAAAVHPYCTPRYAWVAAQARREWLVETDPPMLDLVRRTMLEQLDPHLAEIGWAPHRYDWRLSAEQKRVIDQRYHASLIGRNFHLPEWGEPSSMHDADHACTIAGFASWVERLRGDGHTIGW